VDAKGQVVYLVDDDLAVREGVSELLASHGLAVITFVSATDYMRHARDDTAACLVLDLQLPDVNGLDLQSRLRNEHEIPIIFISGRGDIPSTVRAMKAGAIEFLTKPLDSPALLDAIRAALLRDVERRRELVELTKLNGRFALLTPREREVLPLVASGMLNKQAAATLGISEVTLQLHRGQIMKKMAADSFADLVRMASRLTGHQSRTP
jgi:FixJ family two-component response regulator